MRKVLKAIVCFSMLFFVLLSSSVVVNAAKKKAEDYVTCGGFKSKNVEIGLSLNQLIEKADKEECKPVLSLEDDFQHLYSIQFKESGYINMQIRGNRKLKFLVYTDALKSKCSSSAEDSTVEIYFPVDKGDKYYFCIDTIADYYGPLTAHIFMSFVPTSDIVKINSIKKNKENLYEIHLKNLFKDSQELCAVAKAGTGTALSAWKESSNYPYVSIGDDRDCILTVPDDKDYLIHCEATASDSSHLRCILHINVKDFMNKTKPPKVSKPLNLDAGTKTIVGEGIEGAVIRLAYNKKTYTATVNKKGIYLIKLDDNLKAGKTVTIYQQIEKAKSKKMSYKVSK